MSEHADLGGGCAACGFAWPCDASVAVALSAALLAEREDVFDALVKSNAEKYAALEAENGRLRREVDNWQAEALLWAQNTAFAQEQRDASEARAAALEGRESLFLSILHRIARGGEDAPDLAQTTLEAYRALLAGEPPASAPGTHEYEGACQETFHADCVCLAVVGDNQWCGKDRHDPIHTAAGSSGDAEAVRRE